ncbi:DNA topoisomerase IV subunit A [Thalassoporum mexicanum PCC 7367]|uniref:DNA gyrase/topoisomerase IV subunit A n=1 Tax=Thalassoporum mexicanum TaxID=3457544 RepID=UPI00029FA629|nr:DNA topoisomerase (ATP-hydrolyzing) [Pseudanabaena sp. PCC 7367]AFY69147.1 DNA topoisomerase IV subunit A [Pseudanabaena sp. PCC 7367]
MAKRSKQLNLLASEAPQGQIIPTSLYSEMQQSYLEYAMSVIVGRALPDVRDGLKPVHRRIIFAMHELGLVPDRPYRKCARVVGDVLGKYHPHGDQSVYDALVRLVQDFSSRYPLLAGHGNFGSVDNDPAAAMRYTECRLAPVGHEALLSNINEDVIDFTDNFDGSQQEPLVLPAQLPMLLLNGAAGIAVGMATNIPPHNLSEVVDGLIALIDRPHLADAELFKLIPGPDFPTGGLIIENAGIHDAYTKGRGSITIRGIASVETVRGKGRRSRVAIIVTELPYQVNKAAWIEKIADLANNNKLDGISDIRDESDRTGMRVVIELKKEVNPEVMLEQLYRQTALQMNFGAIMLALSGSQPKQMPLRDILQEFISFREETLTRRYRYELNQAQDRLHIVEGLVTVLAAIDEVIQIIRTSADTATAKASLADRYALSDTQTSAILAMPLRRLTGMEQQNLHDEMVELGETIAKLSVLLGDRHELLKSLKKDLRQLKKKHGDERRTRIISLADVANNGHGDDGEPELSLSGMLELPPEDALVQLNHKGYIKRLDPDSRSAKTAMSQASADDLPIATYQTRTDEDLIVLTAEAKAFTLPVSDIPLSRTARSKGTPLITLLPDAVDQIVTQLAWDRQAETDASLVMLTKQAKIKRSPLTEFSGINSRGLIAAKLKDKDALFWAEVLGQDQQMAIATSGGRVLRLMTDEEQIPTLSRTAIGNQAMRLGRAESLAGVAAFNLETTPELLLITAKGYAKRVRASSIRLATRGNIGTQAISYKVKGDSLIAIMAIATETEMAVTLLVSGAGDNPETRLVQIELAKIPLEPANGQGKAIAKLAKDEHVAQVALLG